MAGDRLTWGGLDIGHVIQDRRFPHAVFVVTVKDEKRHSIALRDRSTGGAFAIYAEHLPRYRRVSLG